MGQNDISHDVRQFIFEHIDSVEQLEILLLLRDRPGDVWTIQAISKQMRSSESSVRQRLMSIQSSGLIKLVGTNPESYSYSPWSSEIDSVVKSLDESYRIRKHSVFELIFSPLKRARKFADAFTIKKSSGETGDESE